MLDLLAEDTTPHQPLTLTELEAARIEASYDNGPRPDWLMAADVNPIPRPSKPRGSTVLRSRGGESPRRCTVGKVGK